MKTKIKIFSSIILFSLMILITSCNNIFLDDFIDKNINGINTIPISDSIIIEGNYTDWINIPVMLSDIYDIDESTGAADIFEFKIATRSDKSQLFIYFRNSNMPNFASETYVVVLSNDLDCDGKRITLTTNYTYLWSLCDNSAPIYLAPSGWAGITSGGATQEIEASVDISSFLTPNGYSLPQNDKIFVSVYSVLTNNTPNQVSPAKDIVKGKWVWFNKPQ